MPKISIQHRLDFARHRLGRTLVKIDKRLKPPILPFSTTKNQLIAKPPETYYNLPMSKENHFDIPFIAALALRANLIDTGYRLKYRFRI